MDAFAIRMYLSQADDLAQLQVRLGDLAKQSVEINASEAFQMAHDAMDAIFALSTPRGPGRPWQMSPRTGVVSHENRG